MQFRTPRGFMAPGVPVIDRVMRPQHHIVEYDPGDHTAHKAKPGTRRASKKKQALLSITHAAIANGAIPQDGGAPKAVRPVAHLKLALALGLRCRESIARRMRHIDRKYLNWENTTTVNRYWPSAPEKPERTYKVGHQYASALELAAMSNYKSDFGLQPTEINFDHVPVVTYNPNVPLTDKEREVFTCLFRHGLFVADGKKEWLSGKVQIAQEQIAAETGTHRDTVRNAIRRLSVSWTEKHKDESGEWVEETHEGLGVLKIVGKPGQWFDARGNALEEWAPGAEWKQSEPNEYIGVTDWAETERERFQSVMQSTRLATSQYKAAIERIFAETLLEWKANNRQEKTFRNEFWHRLVQRERVPRDLADLAAARPPT